MDDPTTVVLTAADGEYTQGDIRHRLAQLGILRGDTVMVHSRLFTLGKLNTVLGKEAVLDAFIDSLIDIVGAEGTLIFPTFTLSVCRTGVFDPKSTVSEMGILSERARLRRDSRRTTHPLYSVAIIGADSDRLLTGREDTSFGIGSLFDLLHQINGAEDTADRVKFLTIGIPVPTEGITYVHYIEEICNAPYRYHKTFRGSITGAESAYPRPYSVDFFVRDLSTDVIFDQERLWETLLEKCEIGRTTLGNSIAAVVPERCLYNTTKQAISAEPDFLCKGGYRRTRPDPS